MSWRMEVERAQREDPCDLSLIWSARDRDDEHAPIEAVATSDAQWAARVASLEKQLAEAEYTVATLRTWVASMWADNACPF